MYLLKTDVIAILIALIGASYVIVLSIIKYGQLVRQNHELRKAGLKVTLPRVKILQILENASGQHHLSAEEVYKTLIDAGEDVGLATVYRVLTQFESAGLVIRHNFDGGHAVFEMTQEDHHDHMVCLESGEIIEFVDLRSVRYIGFEHADAIGRNIINRFEAGEFDVATLFYSRFKSVIQQFPTALQIVPAVVPVKDKTSGATAAYEYEPDEASILASLLPRNISMQVFSALLENAASEQGARMSSMDSATRNAGDMIKKQTITYNRSRQAMFTKELIEIISGAEAL